MTAAITTPSVTVIRPPLRRAPFAEELAAWLDEGIARRPATGRHRPRPAVVIVPEYLHAAPRVLLADLAARRWANRGVALVGYGGRTRGRHALEDARETLRSAGAALVGPSLGIDAARVRAAGFDDADVVLRDHLLDELTGAAS